MGKFVVSGLVLGADPYRDSYGAVHPNAKRKREGIIRVRIEKDTI